MKTTIDIADGLFRQARLVAAREQTTLRDVVNRALVAEFERLGQPGGKPPPWRHAFGALRRLRADIARVNGAIEEVFEQVDEETWR